MPIHTVIRGRIVEGPFQVETGSDERAVTFTIGDRQSGLFRGRTYPIDDLDSCEVISRGAWTEGLIRGLQVNDYVIVLGHLRISKPFDHYDERNLVVATVEADTVGLDIEASN